MTIEELKAQLELERQKNSVLEETIETLKKMQLSEEMKIYLATQQANLRAISLLNSLSSEHIPVEHITTEMEHISEQIDEIDRQINDSVTLATEQRIIYETPCSEFDYKLTNDGDGIKIVKFKGRSADIYIPAMIEDKPVIGIEDTAFQECSINSVILPDTIKYIGEHSFSRCSKLESVVLSLDLQKISRYAFWGCKKLRRITLPDNLKYIDRYAFCETSLQKITIPESVVLIQSDAFSHLNINGQPLLVAIKGKKTRLEDNAFGYIKTNAYCHISSLASAFFRFNTKPLSECPWLK